MFARPSARLPISFVDVANRDGAALAAQHGVRSRPAPGRGDPRATGRAGCGGPSYWLSGRDIVREVPGLIARLGHPYIPVAHGNFTYSSGIVAMNQLLDEDPRIDGVSASNDLMALGAIQALQAHGQLVPDAVSVVGFDDSSVASVSRPALTTIRQPIQEMTVAMARILLESFAQPDRRPISVIFEPALVIRASS